MSQRIYGIYMATPPTLSDGDVHPLLLTSEGKLDMGIGATDLDKIAAMLEGRAIAASGQLLTCAASAADDTVTVVALATYRVTAVNGVIYLGIADSTTDANVIWTVSAGETQGILIPSGTSLHFRGDTDGTVGRLARVV